jgi:hypothetical protein
MTRTEVVHWESSRCRRESLRAIVGAVRSLESGQHTSIGSCGGGQVVDLRFTPFRSGPFPDEEAFNEFLISSLLLPPTSPILVGNRRPGELRYPVKRLASPVAASRSTSILTISTASHHQDHFSCPFNRFLSSAHGQRISERVCIDACTAPPPSLVFPFLFHHGTLQRSRFDMEI